MEFKGDHVVTIHSAKPGTRKVSANGELLNYWGTVLFLYSSADTGLVPTFVPSLPYLCLWGYSEQLGEGTERKLLYNTTPFPRFQELILPVGLREVEGGPGSSLGVKSRRIPHSLPPVLPSQALGWPELP